MTTAVLKMALHCQGCLDRIGKTVLKTKGWLLGFLYHSLLRMVLICLLVWLIGCGHDVGVKEMAIDKEKETVTVKGTMDVKALAENLMEKLRRQVLVVPPKKEKDGDKEGEKDKEGSGKKKKGGGGGGGEGGGKDLHMFVWSSSASPVSEGGIHVFRGGDYGNDQLPVGGVAHQKGLLFSIPF